MGVQNLSSALGLAWVKILSSCCSIERFGNTVLSNSFFANCLSSFMEPLQAQAAGDTTEVSDDNDVVLIVPVSYDQLKSTALKLERMESNSSKDLHERRTPTGRGGASSVQNEIRAQKATRKSRLVSKSEMLSRAVKDAVADSATSSRKVLSMEEQRELNTQRRLARHGLLQQSKPNPQMHPRKDSEETRKHLSPEKTPIGTHGILGRSVHSSPDQLTHVTEGSYSPKGKPSLASPKRRSIDLTRPSGAAAMFNQAFSSALVDHQSEDAEERGGGRRISIMEPAAGKVSRNSVEAEVSKPAEGSILSRLGGSSRRQSHSRGILSSPPVKESSEGRPQHVGVPSPDAVIHRHLSGSRRSRRLVAGDERGSFPVEDDAGLQITIHRKRPHAAATSKESLTEDSYESTSSELYSRMEAAPAKRKKLGSVVVFKTT